MAHPHPGAEQVPSPQPGQPPNPQPPQGGYPMGPPPGAPNAAQPGAQPPPPPGAQPPGAQPPPGMQPPPGWPAQGGYPAGQAPAAVPAASGVQMTPATWCRLVALLATPLGLSLPFNSTCMWVTMTAWAAFAMLAALVQAFPILKPATSPTASRDWTVGAVGAGCLVLFWVLVALPSVASNTGFTLTVAAVAAAAGAIIAPGRRW